jgi:hypothetical protein
MGSAYIILSSLHAGEALVRFLIIGELPGNMANISAGGMLLLIITLTCMVVLFGLMMLLENVQKPQSKSLKESLPKKRYSN